VQEAISGLFGMPPNIDSTHGADSSFNTMYDSDHGQFGIVQRKDAPTSDSSKYRGPVVGGPTDRVGLALSEGVQHEIACCGRVDRQIVKADFPETYLLAYWNKLRCETHLSL
jgi:hypothetical protein